MPEGHAQLCERHIAASVVMQRFAAILELFGFKNGPRDVVGAYLQRAGVFSLQQPMPPGKSPRNIAPHRNPSGLPLILRCFSVPESITSSLCAAHSAEYIRLQPLHFSYEKGRRVLSLRLVRAQIAITAA